MRYDVLAVDIDGTLLNSRSEIPEAHAEALRKADEAGVRIVFASGRMLPATIVVGEQLGLTRQPAVGYNGGRVVDENDNVLLHLPVPADLAQTLVERFAALGHHINYYLEDTLYIDTPNEWGDLYARRTGSTQVEAGDLRQFDGKTPTKVLIVADIPVVEALFPPYRDEFGERLYVTITNPEYLEFMNRDVSKGIGLSHAVAHLGVPRERVAAIGDANNDLSMIEWAGCGVAMASAPEHVRAAADVIAPSSDENGLAWFIEEHVL